MRVGLRLGLMLALVGLLLSGSPAQASRHRGARAGSADHLGSLVINISGLRAAPAFRTFDMSLTKELFDGIVSAGWGLALPPTNWSFIPAFRVRLPVFTARIHYALQREEVVGGLTEACPRNRTSATRASQHLCSASRAHKHRTEPSGSCQPAAPCRSMVASCSPDGSTDSRAVATVRRRCAPHRAAAPSKP
jgi:hypothetical protein